MSDYLLAVRRFEQGPEISMFDLGAGVLLEYFAGPLLIFTAYKPLLQRDIVPPWAPEIILLNELAPPADHPDRNDANIRIGRGLDRRLHLLHMINRVAIGVRVAVIMAFIGILLASFSASSYERMFAILGGWFFAMVVAMIVCLSGQHWRARGGFRRNPG